MTSAAAQLLSSKLSDQLETLNTDVDLASLNLAVANDASFPLLELVTSADIERTIAGSSTLTIVAHDRDLTLWRATTGGGFVIGKGHDVEIDGLWFRLMNFSIDDSRNLTLTFVDREVAVLKSWPPTDGSATPWRSWPASKFGAKTRFKFAQSLIDDVKSQLRIPFICPGLTDGNQQQPVSIFQQAATQGSFALPANAAVTVKNRKATQAQRTVIEAILDTGVQAASDMQVSDATRRRIMIAAIATATQESDMGSDTGPPGGRYVGVFQQDRLSSHWLASGDPGSDAYQFYLDAIAAVKEKPTIGTADLAEAVQHSGQGALYAQWVDEATNTVAAYLGPNDNSLPPAVTDTTAQLPDPTKGTFNRGSLTTLTAANRKHATIVYIKNQGNKVAVYEDNWKCLNRLASEIGWHAYMVSGRCFMVDDFWLFHRDVAMTITPDTDGVDSIAGNFTQGLNKATLTVTCHADRWKAAPGEVIAVDDFGPGSGRWLVESVGRSLFNPLTTIELRKPVASIPESAAPEHGAGQSSGVSTYVPPDQLPTTTGSSAGTGAGKRFKTSKIPCQPIPSPYNHGHGAEHPTLGLADYPAYDFFADAGSPVVSPENGIVTKLSGFDPSLGPTNDGVHFGKEYAGGALGWSVYVTGDSGAIYYLTHLATRTCTLGQAVSAAQQVGTVADYAKYGTPSHCHCGVHSGGFNIYDLDKAEIPHADGT